MIDYRLYELNLKEKLQYYCCSYLVFFGIAYLFYKSFLISLAAGTVCVFFENAYCNYLNEKRMALFREEFRDLLYSISSSMAAQRSLPESLKEAENNLKNIYKGDTPLFNEIAHINRCVLENKMSEEKLLIDLAERSNVVDLKNFVDVYVACRTIGGDMQKVIGNTIEIISEKIQTKKEIDTIMSQKKFEAKIVGAIPIIIILFLNLSSDSYLTPLYTSFFGRVVMSIALGIYVFALKLTFDMVGNNLWKK